MHSETSCTPHPTTIIMNPHHVMMSFVANSLESFGTLTNFSSDNMSLHGLVNVLDINNSKP